MKIMKNGFFEKSLYRDFLVEAERVKSLANCVVEGVAMLAFWSWRKSLLEIGWSTRTTSMLWRPTKLLLQKDTCPSLSS